MHRHYLIASQVRLHLRSLDNSILSLAPHSHSRRPNSIISWQEECGMWGDRGRQGGNDDDDGKVGGGGMGGRGRKSAP